jgi:uncharacterized protein
VKVFVDTSALYALLDEDDRWHWEAARDFRWLAVNAELVTHNYVVLEAIALARPRLGVAAVDRLVDALLPLLTTIWVDEATHNAALELHRAGGRPSLVDQVSFVVLRHAGLEVAFAFDPDFERQGYRRPVVPAEHPPRSVHEDAQPYASGAGADLVSVTEMATRSGRSINTIQSWRRRHSDFPAPVVQLAAGPVWSWPVVETWISTRDSRLVAAR